MVTIKNIIFQQSLSNAKTIPYQNFPLRFQLCLATNRRWQCKISSVVRRNELCESTTTKNYKQNKNKALVQITKTGMHLKDWRGQMVSTSDSHSSKSMFEFALTTTWICLTVAASSNPCPSPALVNSQLVCLQPGGILSNVMFNLNHLFLSVVCSVPQASAY